MLDSGRRSVFIFKFICFIFKFDCPGESKPVTNNFESFMVDTVVFFFRFRLIFIQCILVPAKQSSVSITY